MAQAVQAIKNKREKEKDGKEICCRIHALCPYAQSILYTISMSMPLRIVHRNSCPFLFASCKERKKERKKTFSSFRVLLRNLTIVNLPVLLLDAQPLLQTLACLPERARPRDMSLSAGMPVAVAGNVSFDVGIVL